MITLRDGRQIQFVVAPTPAPTPASLPTPPSPTTPAELTTSCGIVLFYFPNCVTTTGSGFPSVDSGGGRIYLAKIETSYGEEFRFYYRGNIRDLQQILRDVQRYEVSETDEVKDTPMMTYEDDAIYPVLNGG